MVERVARSPIDELKFWVSHYDKINIARWGDDDKEPPTWKEVREKYLSDWRRKDMSWDYWHTYVTAMIVYSARDLLDQENLNETR